MKEHTVGEALRHIVGGTPAEVLVKLILGAFAMLWANLSAIGVSIFGYILLIVADSVMGVMLSKSRGIAFSPARFLKGPGSKIMVTALMYLCAAVVDGMIPNAGWIPDQPVFFVVTMFVSVTALLDVAQKYGDLTGSKLVARLRKLLGHHVEE